MCQGFREVGCDVRVQKVRYEVIRLSTRWRPSAPKAVARSETSERWEGLKPREHVRSLVRSVLTVAS